MRRGTRLPDRRCAALALASALSACGPSDRAGGEVTGVLTGSGPWQTDEAPDLSFTIAAETEDDGREGVRCSLEDAGDGTSIYRLYAHGDDIQRGLVLEVAVDGYAGPDTYFRSEASEVPGLVATLSTDLQSYDLTTESGGECDVTVDAGEATGSFDCREIPEYDGTTASEQIYTLAGAWDCLGVVRIGG